MTQNLTLMSNEEYDLEDLKTLFKVIVRQAIDDYVKLMHPCWRKKKELKDAFITEVSEDRLDYIIKVESKGKKSDASVVYLIIMKEGNNMKPSFDAYQVDKVKAFLNINFI